MKTTITAGPPMLVVIDGRLDTVSSPEFEKQIESILSSDMQDVQIDCSELTYISSSGLRLFLKLQKGSTAKGGRLVIRGLRPEIKEVFDMTGFTSLFQFE